MKYHQHDREHVRGRPLSGLDMPPLPVPAPQHFSGPAMQQYSSAPGPDSSRSSACAMTHPDRPTSNLGMHPDRSFFCGPGMQQQFSLPLDDPQPRGLDAQHLPGPRFPRPDKAFLGIGPDGPFSAPALARPFSAPGMQQQQQFSGFDIPPAPGRDSSYFPEPGNSQFARPGILEFSARSNPQFQAGHNHQQYSAPGNPQFSGPGMLGAGAARPMPELERQFSGPCTQFFSGPGNGPQFLRHGNTQFSGPPDRPRSAGPTMPIPELEMQFSALSMQAPSARATPHSGPGVQQHSSASASQTSALDNRFSAGSSSQLPGRNSHTFKSIKQIRKENQEPELGPDFCLAKRTGFGTRGKKMILKSNYFLVPYDSTLVAYHYNVKFKPQATNRVLMTSLMDDAIKKNVFSGALFIYDGGPNIYTTCQLRNGPVLTVDGLCSGEGDDERTFSMTVKQVAVVDFAQIKTITDTKKVRGVLQILDIALRNQFTASALRVGRSLYNQTDPIIAPIDEQIEIWRGHFQALRATQAGLAMNIDDTSVVMNKAGPVLDMMRGLLGKTFDPSRGIDKKDVEIVNKAIKNMRVYAVHSTFKRQYKLSKLADVGANRDTFESDGKTLNVEDYFYQHYEIKLKYPNLPCAKVGAKGTSMPLELLEIVSGQRFTQHLSNDQRLKMMSLTSAPPKERFRTLQLCADTVHASVENDKSAKDFRLSVNRNMLEVEGRLLQPPALEYRYNNVVTPTNGSWNLADVQLLSEHKCPPEGYRAVCIHMSNRVRYEDFQHFWVGFQTTLWRTGLRLEPVAMFEQPRRDVSLAEQLIAYQMMYDADVFIILLDWHMKKTYIQIKEVCDTVLGIPSQCICSNKLMTEMGGSAQYHASVALKMNVKLGGCNVKLNAPPPLPQHMRHKPIMVMGADVHHPPPKNTKSPSIAGVVGSYDPQFASYNTVISPQMTHKRREETIRSMESITTQLLVAFYKKTGRKPESLIMYRDGVGEGHFDNVMKYEVAAMIKSFESIEHGYRPKITFLIVQKRNKMRFFPQGEDGDRNGNLRAGTVVDQSVCHPTAYDFYLCSHTGLKGTSKPTHYFVMYDENNFCADDIQELTNDMCYLFQRCSRSVSVPAPAYYAHHASYRTSMYSKPMAARDSLAGKLYYL